MPIPTIPLNNVQERVERSIFEAIREKLVEHGYLPERAAYDNTQHAQDLFQVAKTQIVDTSSKVDSIDIYGHGNALAKGIEACPRIVCVTRRVMPGDIGKKIYGEYSVNALDPDAVVKAKHPYMSTNLHIDIEVVSKTARQDRIMNAILAEAIGGTMGFVDVYDTTINERFLVRQFNFYDIPDTENGIIKKVYSYEIPDIYLTDGMTQQNFPLIKEIKVEIFTVPENTIITADGTVPDPADFEVIDIVFVDLTGVSFGDYNDDYSSDFL